MYQIFCIIQNYENTKENLSSLLIYIIQFMTGFLYISKVMNF